MQGGTSGQGYAVCQKDAAHAALWGPKRGVLVAMLGGVGEWRDSRRLVGSDEWGTPKALFGVLHAEFGFTVDACAVAGNAKLERYWSPEKDGLRQSWAGERVWCNPPYSKIGPWARKAFLREAQVAVLLVPSRTGTEWWHAHGQYADEIRWVRGRLKFERPQEAGNAPEDSVLLVYRREA